MNNYFMLNGKRIDLTDAQVREIEKNLGLSRTQLSDIAVGETFKLGDYEFVVLEHADGSTTAILKDVLPERCAFGEANNNFKDDGCLVKMAKLVADGRLPIAKFRDSYNAWKNHISHGNCYSLARSMDARIQKCLQKGI